MKLLFYSNLFNLKKIDIKASDSLIHVSQGKSILYLLGEKQEEPFYRILRGDTNPVNDPYWSAYSKKTNARYQIFFAAQWTSVQFMSFCVLGLTFSWKLRQVYFSLVNACLPALYYCKQIINSAQISSYYS